MPRSQEAEGTPRGRILVVDDQEHMCWLLAEILMERGHVVQTAHTAAGALRAIAAGFDCEVAVVDYRLPDSTGLALMGEMSARLPKLRSVIMTSYGNDALRRLALEQGFFAYLDKPFQNDVMVETVERALKADGALHTNTAQVSDDVVRVPRAQMEKLASISRFMAVIAHELGNPLTIIGSSLQHLHKRFVENKDGAANFTATALENVQRMHVLLRRTVDFTVTRTPHRELANLKDIVGDVLRFTASECRERGIEVQTSFDDSLPLMHQDVDGVKQILLNLVKNAFDALAHHGGILRVRTRLEVATERAIVDIENDGPPIAADALKCLFRPFYTTKAHGTGLGLFLSRQIAREEGGELVAANIENAVRFTLTLPLDRRGSKR